MKIQISVAGVHPRPDVVWPEGWPVPRIGEEITIEPGKTLFVKHVDYYPNGDGREAPEPFVYVVVAPRPRREMVW